MQTRYTARRIKLTDGLRDYIERHLEKVEALVESDDSAEAQVVLTSESSRCTAEIIVSAYGFTVTAKQETKDIHASIDTVLSKIIRQIKKKKDRRGRHQPLTAREARIAAHHVVEPEEEVRVEEPGDDGHRFVRREPLLIKPMSIDEALLQLEIADESFLVFSNAQTEEVNVVYDRHDGTYGLIEPGF